MNHRIWVLGLAVIVFIIILACRALEALPGVTFVTQTQFNSALDSRSSRSYFGNMGAGDLAARGCVACDYRQSVLDALITVRSDDDRVTKLVRHARIADHMCRGHHVPVIEALPRVPWKFAVLSDHIEGGLPHTHHDVVCLPLSVITRYDGDQLVRLLIHEKLHVLQKMHPHLCDAEVTRAGWVKVARRDQLDRNTLMDSRSNPDTDQYIYRRQDRCPTINIFNDSVAGKSLTDTRSVCVLQEDRTDPSTVTDEYEHPFEMIAYLLSEQVVPLTRPTS